MESFTVSSLVPMAHVADVTRSVAFYEKLGLKVGGKLEKDGGGLRFAYMNAERAEIMFVEAESPVSRTEQGILFYAYTRKISELRDSLIAQGVAVSEITYPFYMPGGEFRIEDPDGYVLMAAQI